MGIRPSTRYLNFLIYCIKKSNRYQGKSIAWEFDFTIDGEEIRPDMLVYFNAPGSFYSLIELMYRTKVYDEEDKKNQYYRYQSLRGKTESLPAEIMPAKPDPLYINYVFLNTNQNIISKFVEDVLENDGTIHVYEVDTNERHFQSIQKKDNINHEFFVETSNNIENNAYWSQQYVPFTVQDLSEVKGQEGNKVKISRVTSRIITSHMLAFIIHRKIIEKTAEFSISEVVDFLFDSSSVTMGEKERKGMIRKIRLVFKYLHSDLFPTLNLDVINRISDNKYRIVLRKTATLQDRFKEIEKQVNEHLATRTLDEFI